MYVKVIDGVANHYTIGQLRSDNPNTSFPASPSNDLLAGYSVYPLNATPQPLFDPLTQKVVETAPTQLDGAWVQTWSVVAMTSDEIDAMRATMEVSMRQARLALLQEGLLSQIEAAIAALPDGQREQAQIEWDYGSNVQRISPWVVQLTAALGMTPAEADQLFALAGSL